VSPSKNPVAGGSDRRGATVTVELLDGRWVTLEGQSQEQAAELLLRRYGRPRRLLSTSTPESIYADLQGRSFTPVVKPALRAIFLETPMPPTRMAIPNRERLQAARRALNERG
jgi:hypothetical protein